jgi:hypothetical protein
MAGVPASGVTHHFSDAGENSSHRLSGSSGMSQDVSLSGDALANSRVRENRSELVTDAVVSQGWHRESERELKPWKPDDEFSDTTSINLSNTWRLVVNDSFLCDSVREVLFRRRL